MMLLAALVTLCVPKHHCVIHSNIFYSVLKPASWSEAFKDRELLIGSPSLAHQHEDNGEKDNTKPYHSTLSQKVMITVW
jgi:hypothetical protein